MEVTSPSIRLNDVQIVANRTALMSLVNFCNNNANQSFHLELIMVGDTLTIARKVKNAKGQSAENAFGRNFESQCTKKNSELEDVTGHHRVIMYKLGNLNVIVRHEADAYVEESDAPGDADRSPCTYPDGGPAANSAGMASSEGSPPITVIAKGEMVPQHLILEMQTTGNRPYMQMYLGRTPNFCGGTPSKDEDTLGQIPFRHKYQYKSTGQKEVEVWEEKGRNQEVLQKLVWFLKQLIEAVKKTEHRSAILYVPKKKKLVNVTVFAAKERIDALLADLVERFWTKE
jgi:hypothetical protein